VESMKREEREEFWRGHIEAASKFDGSMEEYCQQHGLKRSTFGVYRTKFGLVRTRTKKVRTFVPVVVTESRGYPDPEWLSRFLKAWVG
jgi:hypothetical protein